MIKLKDLLKEDKFIAFYKKDRVTINAKSLWDAKKQIIAKLKVPKKDVGLVSVLNKTEYDKQKFRFEGKLTEMNEPWFEITYKDSRGRKKTDSMRAKNPKEAKKDFVNLMKGRGFKVLKVVKEEKVNEAYRSQSIFFDKKDKSKLEKLLKKNKGKFPFNPPGESVVNWSLNDRGSKGLEWSGIPKAKYNKAVEFFMKNKLNPRG